MPSFQGLFYFPLLEATCIWGAPLQRSLKHLFRSPTNQSSMPKLTVWFVLASISRTSLKSFTCYHEPTVPPGRSNFCLRLGFLNRELTCCCAKVECRSSNWEVVGSTRVVSVFFYFFFFPTFPLVQQSVQNGGELTVPNLSYLLGFALTAKGSCSVPTKAWPPQTWFASFVTLSQNFPGIPSGWQSPKSTTRSRGQNWLIRTWQRSWPTWSRRTARSCWWTSRRRPSSIAWSSRTPKRKSRLNPLVPWPFKLEIAYIFFRIVLHCIFCLRERLRFISLTSIC